MKVYLRGIMTNSTNKPIRRGSKPKLKTVRAVKCSRPLMACMVVPTATLACLISAYT